MTMDKPPPPGTSFISPPTIPAYIPLLAKAKELVNALRMGHSFGPMSPVETALADAVALQQAAYEELAIEVAILKGRGNA